MKITTIKTLRTAAAVTLLAALAACGGGGGDSSPTPGGGNSGGGTGGNTTVVADAGTLQASAGTATYGAGTVHKSAFDELNASRLAAGAGALVQSANIDTAATAHALYVHTNIQSLTDWHTEDSAKPDFYAATPAARIAKGGFSANYTTEVIGGTGASMQGADCVRGLLNTVYHAVALMSQSTHVGVGFNTDLAGIPMCVIKLATASTDTYGQVMPAGSVSAYPYNGQTNVLETFQVGSEVPRPSAALFPNQTAGTPVIVNVANADYVNAKAAGTLNATVTKFELKDAAGNLVPAHILSGTDLKAGTGVTLNADNLLPGSYAVLVPQSPLPKGQTYTVSFSANLKTGAAAASKTWTFTTNP